MCDHHPSLPQALLPRHLEAARPEPPSLDLALPPKHPLIHGLALLRLLPRRLARFARPAGTRTRRKRRRHPVRVHLARPAFVGGRSGRERRGSEARVVGERDGAQVRAVVGRDGCVGEDGVEGRLQEGALAAGVDELGEAERELRTVWVAVWSALDEEAKAISETTHRLDSSSSSSRAPNRAASPHSLVASCSIARAMSGSAPMNGRRCVSSRTEKLSTGNDSSASAAVVKRPVSSSCAVECARQNRKPQKGAGKKQAHL